MSDTLYRLQTESGLSEEYSLERLQHQSASGLLKAGAQCTPDNGQTWVPVDSLAPPESTTVAVAATSSSDTTEQNDATAAAVPEEAADSSESSNGSPDSSSTAEHSRTRRLKRINKTAGDSKLARRRSEKESRTPSAQAKATKNLVGAKLAGGRYTIKALLGKGSMAYVFLVTDSRLETDAVVKVPKPEKFTTEDFRERFKRESQLLVRFSHPHVVKVLDVGEYEKLPYVVMQLLAGGSLADRMQKEADQQGRMTPDSLKSWVREVGRALDFCYRKGMVHRDVKPANILFDEDNNPFVADFGLSKIMYGEHAELNSSETAAGIVLGTPNYISPEVVLGQKYDGRADQYSMGITIYHALTGSPPMQGNSATMTMINQTQKVLPLLNELRPDVSHELAVVVRKGIEKDPEQRFESCEDFAEALLEALKAPVQKSVSATAPPAPNSPPATAAAATSPPTATSATGATIKKGDSASGSPTRPVSRSSNSSRRSVPRAPENPSSSGSRSPSGAASRSSSASSKRIARGRASGRSGQNKPQVAPDPDLEWLDLGSQNSLPPKAGRSRKDGASARKKQNASVIVMGQEVRPALAIAFFIGVLLLTGYVVLSKLTPSDSAVAVEADTTDLATNIPNAPAVVQRSGPANGKPAKPAAKPAKSKDSAQTAQKTTAPAKSANQPGGRANQPKAPAKSRATAAAEKSSAKAIYETIPGKSGESLTVGFADSPVLIVGNRVWDREAKKVRATLQGSYSPQAQTALSPNGQLFAAASKPPDQQDTEIFVWDTETGQIRFTAAGDSKRFVDLMLLSNSTLFAGDRWSEELLLWNCESGKRRKSLRVSNARFKRGNAAISSDGQFVALVSGGQLGVIGTDDGKPVAIMYPPDPIVRLKRASLLPEEKPRGNRRKALEPAEPVYAATQSLSFSPENIELAGLSTHPRLRMMSWNGMGDLTVDQAVSAPQGKLQEHAFQWFPERDAWLVAGTILDRATGRVIAVTRLANGDDGHVSVYDNDHVIGSMASAPTQLSIVPVPWTQMTEGLQNLQNADDAILRKNSEVSVQIDLNPLLDNASEGVQNLQKALRATVVRESLKVEPDQKTIFRLRIATTAKDKAPVHLRQTPPALRGKVATKFQAPDEDCVVLELMVPDESQPVWRTNLGTVTATKLAPKSSAGKAEQLAASIDEVLIPYYMPKNPKSLALPVVLE